MLDIILYGSIVMAVIAIIFYIVSVKVEPKKGVKAA